MCGILIVLIAALCACAPGTGYDSPEEVTLTAMDTVMTLRVYGSDTACEKLSERITGLDKMLSVTDSGSEIYALNNNGKAEISNDTHALLKRSVELCGELEGSFDITVYPAVQAWGFTTGEHRVPTAEELRSLADRIDYRQVKLTDTFAELPEGCMVDPGAAAKGYLADVCDDVLSECGATGAVLNLGGTVKLYGKKPDGSDFKIGVADPENDSAYIGYLTCSSGVAATSGGYERYFEKNGKRYIHIIDPDTADPVDNGTLSVTIFSNDGVAADSLSTALFVMGIDKAIEYYQAHGGFDFIILTQDGSLYITEGIKDSFTLGDGYSYDIKTVGAEVER